MLSEMGMWRGAAALENNLVVLQMVQQLSYDPATLLPSMCPKKCENVCPQKTSRGYSQ